MGEEDDEPQDGAQTGEGRGQRRRPWPEIDYAPGEPKGTPWHAHRGFETVTYMLDGVFRHPDSNGGGGLITDGDTQWMTAGADCHAG